MACVTNMDLILELKNKHKPVRSVNSTMNTIEFIITFFYIIILQLRSYDLACSAYLLAILSNKSSLARKSTKCA